MKILGLSERNQFLEELESYNIFDFHDNTDKKIEDRKYPLAYVKASLDINKVIDMESLYSYIDEKEINSLSKRKYCLTITSVHTYRNKTLYGDNFKIYFLYTGYFDAENKDNVVLKLLSLLYSDINNLIESKIIRNINNDILKKLESSIDTTKFNIEEPDNIWGGIDVPYELAKTSFMPIFNGSIYRVKLEQEQEDLCHIQFSSVRLNDNKKEVTFIKIDTLIRFGGRWTNLVLLSNYENLNETINSVFEFRKEYDKLRGKKLLEEF